MDRTLRRKRSIGEAILRLLVVTWEANPEVAVPAGQILEGFAAGATPYGEEEISAVVVDLVDRGLAEVRQLISAGQLAEKGYRATARGRDFYAHRFPWELMDEFARKNRAPGTEG